MPTFMRQYWVNLTSLKQTISSWSIGYVHVIRGQVEVNGVTLNSGDALKIKDTTEVSFTNAKEVELLFFDLPY